MNGSPIQPPPTGNVILAIVGSTRFTNPNAYAIALRECSLARNALNPDEIISGEADGMDSFARAFARLMRIDYRGFKPANQRWEPDGFKARNETVAQTCTHLLAVRCAQSQTYGSGWTADRAEALGRRVRRVIIPGRDARPVVHGDWNAA